MKKSIIIICLLYFSTIVLAANNNKTKVTVYYEAMCDDSEEFISAQLLPTYSIMKKYMTVELVPFGKAIFYKATNGKWRFSCQHGAEECMANAVHACGLDQDIDEEMKIKFANCLITSRNKDERAESGTPTVNQFVLKPSLRECTDNIGLNYEELKKCLKLRAGNLVASYGRKTIADIGGMTYVPTIFFDGVFLQNLQDLAESNLFKVICKLQDFPNECLAPIKYRSENKKMVTKHFRKPAENKY